MRQLCNWPGFDQASEEALRFVQKLVDFFTNDYLDILESAQYHVVYHYDERWPKLTGVAEAEEEEEVHAEADAEIDEVDSESEDEDDKDHDMDTGLWRTLDLAAVIETALTHLLRLRRLEFRGHIEQLSFERILAFHYESLEGLALDSKEGSDAITESSSRSYGSPPAHVS